MIFAYHGYPYLDPSPDLPPRSTTRGTCTSAASSEEGTTTTPFDMAVLNELDRFHLAIVGDRARAGPRHRAAAHRSSFATSLIEHTRYVREHGEDMPEIRNWSLAVWQGCSAYFRLGPATND